MEVEHQKIIGETPTSVLSLVLLLLILPFSVTPHSCCVWFWLSIQLMHPHYVMVLE